MSLRKFITNPYAEGIYTSFLGTDTDETFYERLQTAVKEQLGTSKVEVLKVECGVGLAILCRVDHNSLVHLKIIKGTDAIHHQTESSKIQSYLVKNDFPCTVPIGLPIILGDCSLQFEEHNSTGEYRDSHLAEVMRLQAEQLATLNHLLDNYRSETLDHLAKKTIPRDKVWQNPPQAVFSFDKHNSGDEFIKTKASAAKAIFEEPNARRQILSHEDWSNKHFRFIGKKISIIYDWDSLCKIDELYNLGLAVSTFTATWYFPTRIFPTQEEAKAFVQAYSDYSAKKFTSDEIRIISSYAAYTIAYITRCVFAINNGNISGNDIEPAFLAIKDGLYF